MNNYKKLRNYQRSLIDHLTSFKWQWWATLRPPKGVKTSEGIKDHIKRWRLSMTHSERLRLAFTGVICHDPYTHIHLLILGVNSAGKTLSDANADYWAGQWPGDAEIKSIYDLEGVVSYLVNQNMLRDKFEELDFGTNTLKQLKAKGKM